MMTGLAMDRAARDLRASVQYLAGRGRPEAGVALGVVGFGMGGSLALWAASFTDEIVAVVGFYPVRAAMATRWDRYADKAVLLHAAEKDRGGLGEPGIREAVAAITTAGGRVELHEYPGTRHSFANQRLPEVYHPDAARRSWDRTLDFLGQAMGEIPSPPRRS